MNKCTIVYSKGSPGADGLGSGGHKAGTC